MRVNTARGRIKDRNVCTEWTEEQREKEWDSIAADVETIVRFCLERGIEVECLPGATAFVPALINSGLPADRFIFEGFLPQKKGRKTRLDALQEEARTMIFYESPFRLVKTLEQFVTVFGADRPASVSRELTKLFEENARGSLAELVAHFSAKTVKGEIVLIVGGKNS